MISWLNKDGNWSDTIIELKESWQVVVCKIIGHKGHLDGNSVWCENCGKYIRTINVREEKLKRIINEIS